jgi:hypothetical protein
MTARSNRRNLAEIHSAGDKLAIDQNRIAEQSQIRVIDHSMPFNALMAGIELVSKDSQFDLRSLLLREGQDLSKYPAHCRSHLILAQ